MWFNALFLDQKKKERQHDSSGESVWYRTVYGAAVATDDVLFRAVA